LTRCDECGKEVTLPFKCNFCKGHFCVDHRLPENHACLFAPPRTPLGHWKAKKKTKKWKTSVPVRKSYSSRSSRGKKVALAIIAIFSIALLLLVFLQNPITLPPITFPDSGSKTYSHEELVNYALTLINNDRQSNGLENVTLSNINSAQIHADNMLQHDFFSHWDPNGYKPHMRYTLAGGQGSASENCAWMYSSGFIDPKEALEDLQWQMMYDDSDSNWGHKNNILTPFHNKVSIGISYNDNKLYFVQDFGNEYVEWETLTVSNNEVVMKGTILKQGLSIEHVAIYYDNPVPLTVEQLMNPPFQGSYDMGTFVGMVLPSGWEAVGGITISAQVWTQTGQNFEIRFTLSKALSSYGRGVYTLCLQTDLENTPTEDNSLTSYSFWYEG
jgi:uncharacterized protein YkwD